MTEYINKNHSQLKAMDAYMQLLSTRTPRKAFLLRRVDCCRMLVRSKKVEISRLHPARLHENGFE